jgi:hypothetical protein
MKRNELDKNSVVFFQNSQEWCGSWANRALTFDRSVREFTRLKEICILQKRVRRSVDVIYHAFNRSRFLA